MKKIVITCLVLLMAVCSYAQYFNNDQSDVIMGKHYGKTYSGLTNVVALVGTAQKTLIIDGGGTWSITNSVSLPTNINLLVTRDTLISVSTDMTFAVNGFIFSGNWQIFSGLGTPTGPCANVFVYTNWVGTNSSMDILYLGTPYGRIAVTSDIPDVTSYMSGTAITNLATNMVNLNSNGIMNSLTSQVANATNALTTHVAQVTANMVTNGQPAPSYQTGTTGIFDMITWSNFPIYGVSVNDSGGQVFSFDTSASNRFVPMSNWTVIAGNNYGTMFSAAAETFTPAISGLWEVHSSLSINLDSGAIGDIPHSIEFLMIVNDQTNNVTGSTAAYLGQVVPPASALGGVDLNITGYWQINVGSPYTNAWKAYIRYNPRDTGNVSIAFGTLSMKYVGDPTLTR